MRKSVLSCALLITTVAALFAGSAQVGEYAEAATPVVFQTPGTERLVGGYSLLASRLGIVGGNKPEQKGGLRLFRAGESSPNEVTLVEEPSGDGVYVEEFHGDGTYVEEFHGDGSQTDSGDNNDNNVVVIGDGGAGDGVEVVTPDETTVSEGDKGTGDEGKTQTLEWPVVLEQTTNDSEGNSYTVMVTFGENAGIPHGAELKISSLGTTDSRVSAQHAAISLKDDELAVGDWFLDVSLVDNNQVCVPTGTVEVLVTTDAIDPSLSDALEVVTSSSATASENTSGSAAKGSSSVKFSTSTLGEIGLTAVERKATEVEVLGETIVVWAPRPVSVKTNESFDIPDTLPSEGAVKIGTLELSVDPSRSWPTSLYVSTERSIASPFQDGIIMSVDGQDAVLFGAEGTSEPVAVSTDDKFLLEWDTGYRDDAIEIDDIKVAGPLPIGVEATVTDVRANYMDGESVVGISDDMKYDYDVIGAREFSFAIKGETWAPDKDHKQRVSISNLPVGDDHDIQVWHVTDDGFEQIEDAVFEGGAVTFTAAEDGTYVLIDKVSLEREFAVSDGETYRMTLSYDGSAGLPRDVYPEVTSVAAEGPDYLMSVIESAKLLGKAAERVAYTQLFDIAFVDPLTGMRHRPSEGVLIEVELLSEDVAEGETLSVVGLSGDATPVASASDGQAVGFEATDSSSYAVVKMSAVKTVTASDGKAYEVTVTYDSASGIPAGATLEVSEIVEGDKGYDEYVAGSAEAMGVDAKDVSMARAFDISLIDPETGGVCQPTKDVVVSVRLLDEKVSDKSDPSVVHFPSDGGEAQILDSSTVAGAVEFGTDGFSVFVVLYTVDFHWGEYTYNLQGGNEILLSELLRILSENAQDTQENVDSSEDHASKQIDRNATAKLMELAEDLEGVEDVVFSNPKLVEVERTENGDWVLRSRQAFDTDELLTVELVGGEEIKIWVTDERAETYYQDAEGATWKIIAEYSLESGLPTGVELKVRELTEKESGRYLEQAAEALEEDAKNVNIAKAFDITFEKDGKQYHELKEDVQITIQLMDQAVSDGMEVVHIGSETKLVDVEIRDDTLRFASSEFSVFMVVEAKEPYSLAPAVQDLTELSENYSSFYSGAHGFYLSYVSGSDKYCSNVLNGNRAFNEVASVAENCIWYFESAVETTGEEDTYYLYTLINGAKKYMGQSGPSQNTMTLGDTAKTVFKLANPTKERFYFKILDENRWLQHSNGGKGMRLYTDNKDQTNSQIKVTYVSKTVPSDYYNLDGKEYGIARLTSNNVGIALTSVLSTQPIRRLTNVPKGSDELWIDETESAARWTFTNTSGANYTISANIGGGIKYLSLTDDGPALSSDEFNFTVDSNAEGEYSFKANNNYLCANENGFSSSSTNGDNTWFSLVSLFNRPKLTITAGDVTKTYDGTGIVDTTNPNEHTYTVTGLQTEHRVSSLVLTSKNGEVNHGGPYALVASNAVIVDGDGKNVTDLYEITYEPGTLTINRADVTVTADPKSKVYGDPDPELTAEVTGLKNGDKANAITYTLARAEGEGVGEYAITASGDKEQGNYDVTYVPGKLTISRAAATVTADPKSKVYGDSDPELTATVGGLKNGDDEGVITYTLARAKGEDYGTYDITASGESVQGNYDVTYVSGKLTIRRIPVTVTAVSMKKEYGDVIPGLEATVEGVGENPKIVYDATGDVTTVRVLGQDDAEKIRFTLARGAGVNAGTYTITASGDAEQGNYAVTYIKGQLIINKAAAKVTVKAASKDYGDPDPELTAEVTGLKNGDDESVVKYFLSREEGEDVGKYDIKAAILPNANYSIDFVSNKLTINKATAKVAVKAASKDYGDPDPELTAEVTGLKNGDKANAISYTLARAEGEGVGEYAITASGDKEQGNYDVTYVPGKLTISRAAVTVTADPKSKVYGDSDPELTATVDGLKNGDDEGVITYTLARAKGEDYGTYAITASGDKEQGNYTVTYINEDSRKLSIVPRVVTVRGISAKDKPYDGTIDVEWDYKNVTLDGALEEDKDNLTVTAAGAFEDASAGDNKVVTLSELKLGGDSASNYKLSDDVLQVRASITKAPVTVKADDLEVFYGEAIKLTATVTGLIGEDTIDYVLTRNPQGEDIGTYTITPEQKGEESPLNYDVTYETGTLTIKKVTPKVQVIALNPTYTGELQNLVKGKTNAGTLQYSLTEDGTYTDEIPAGTDAGDYTVWYRVTETQNYAGVSGSVVARIKRAPVTLIANSKSVKYDGREHSVTGFTCNVKGLSSDDFSYIRGEGEDAVSVEVTASGSGMDKGMHDVTFKGAIVGKTTDESGNYLVSELVNGAIIIFDQDELIKKSMTGFTGNLAEYEVVVNEAGEELNSGNSLVLKDTFSENQSIDYGSINIEPSANVTYDYSGYTGTFVIPDATKVTITYATRVHGAAGENVEFSNTASLGRRSDDGDAMCTVKSVNEEEIIAPTGTDIEGEGGVYTIRLFTYPEDHLELGLSDVEFRLLDYNQHPLTYLAGDKKGQQVVFTTGEDGYAQVKLTEEKDGLSIHKNTVYYLEMIKAPVMKEGDKSTYYQKDNTLYNFLITDSPSYKYGNIYSYFNNDVLKVRCYPESMGVNVTERFSGNYTPTSDEKDRITFILEKENTVTGGWDEVERHSYAEFKYGSLNFATGSTGWSEEDYGRTYRIREENADISGVDLHTECVVSTQSQGETVSEESNEFLVDPDNRAYSFSLIFTNEYSNHKLTIYALDEETGSLLSGLEFTIFDNKGVAQTSLPVYETGMDGTTSIEWREGFEYNKLYYAMQTAAPEGYLLPDEPQKIYFYFSKGDGPVAPGWEDALNLAESFGTVTISNNNEKTHVPVIITWGLKGVGSWPNEVHHVKIALYRSIDGGEPEAVEGKFVNLDAENNFSNNAFVDLPVVEVTDEDDGAGNNVPVSHSIKYSLVETIYKAEEENATNDITKKFYVSERVSGSGWHVVRNQDAVSVNVRKQWYELGGENLVSDATAKPAVKYDLYRSTKELQDEGIVTRAQLLRHLNDTDVRAVKVRSGMTLKADDWLDEEEALPATDDSGRSYYYFVLEDESSMPQNHEDRYEIKPATGSSARLLTIRNIQTPVTIVITPMDCMKSYGDDDPTFEFVLTVQQDGAKAELAGFDEASGNYLVDVTAPNGEKKQVQFKLERESGENIGNYILTTAGNETQEGYHVKYNSGTLTIKPKKVTVTAEDRSKTYGDDDPALYVILDENNEEVTVEDLMVECQRVPGEDVGEYDITVTGNAEQGNYLVAYLDGTLIINRAEVTVTADEQSKEYGDKDPDLTVKVEGLKNDDEESVVNYSLARSVGEDVGTYDITVSGDETQGNYKVFFVGNKFTISRATLTVSVEDAGKLYGTEDPDWVVDIDGLRGDDIERSPVVDGGKYTYTLREGEELELTLSREPGEDVGTYPITVTGDAEQSNYNVTFVDGKLKISSVELTVTPDNKFKDRLALDPGLTARIVGWAGDEGEGSITYSEPDVDGNITAEYTLNGKKLLTFTLCRTMGDAAGEYVISATGEPVQGNYYVNYETGTFTIIEVHIIDVIQVINDRIDASAKPQYEYVATLDLEGTNLSEMTDWENNTTEFSLGGTGDEAVNSRRLNVPDGAKLTVKQLVTTANSNYDDEITVDNKPYEDSATTCIIEDVEEYYAIRFIHNRICLPVRAMACMDQSDTDAHAATPIGYLPIPEDVQPVDKSYVDGLERSIGYKASMPTNMYFVYDHAKLNYIDEDKSVEDPIYAVQYKNNHFEYRSTDDGEFVTVPDDAEIRLYYWPKYICKIGDTKFYTLNAALDSVPADDKTAKIEMLIGNFDMPVTDTLTIPEGYNITLTTDKTVYEENANQPTNIIRSPGLTGSMFTVSNNSSLILDLITLDGNKSIVAGTDAMVSSAGELTIKMGATLQNANGALGGAVYISGGITTIDAGSVVSNTAVKGGALYISGGTLEIKAGSLTGNFAFDGGAIFMTGGEVNVTGGTLGGSDANRNTAINNGGAFHMEGGTINIESGVISYNRALYGGMVYATNGDVDIINGTFTNNMAYQSGGAIYYAGPGEVKVSGGVVQGNRAESGNGGAIYQGSGTITLSGKIDKGNVANNGAAVYVAAGITNFSGAIISGNSPIEGGAVGVDSAARLYFSGNTQIKDNKIDGIQHNVYLDEDSDDIINTPGLGNNAYIGVYVVSGLRDDNEYERRDACGKFGTYTYDTKLDKFKNDINTTLVAHANNFKIIWTKAINIKLRGIKNNGVLPPTSNNVEYNQDFTYYPNVKYSNIYDLAMDIYNTNSTYSSKIGSDYLYAYTYAENTIEFSKFATSMQWNSQKQKWDVYRNGETQAVNENLVVYYAKGAYISIVNNTEHTFTVGDEDMFVNGKYVLKDSYGYVTAKNYVTQETMLPVKAGDLTLAPKQQIQLLFPGAVNQEWKLNGIFMAIDSEGNNHPCANEPINYYIDKPHGGQEDSLTTDQEGRLSPILTGNTRVDNSGSLEILFGAPTNICKVIGPNGQEMPFATLNEAWNYIKTNELKASFEYENEDENGNIIYTTKTEVPGGTIEMLVDYLQPLSDVLEVDEGYYLKLTTAATSNVQYPYRGKIDTQYDSPRATISRDTDNNGAGIILSAHVSEARTKDQCDSFLFIENVVFDGKALAKKGNGGAISTINSLVEIKNCTFTGYQAQRGGALFMMWGGLKVANCGFSNCTTGDTEDKTGGGAIWTTAKLLTVNDCTFDHCACVSGKSQAGAVFHNISAKGKAVYNNAPGVYAKFTDAYIANTKTKLSDCTFTNCYAVGGSGGTMESDAEQVYLTRCTFNGSYSNKGGSGTNPANGGALNILHRDAFLSNADDYKPLAGSKLEIVDCAFENCQTSKADTNGGAICAANTETIKLYGSSFTNISAYNGGAIRMSAKGTTVDIKGCTFANCTGRGIAGAIYCRAKTLSIGDYTTKDEENRDVTLHTTFTNCVSPKYGGVYQMYDGSGSSVSVTNASFNNCDATNSDGGALYITAKQLQISGATGVGQRSDTNEQFQYTFYHCDASKNGGAVYHSGSNEELSNCTFDSCVSGINGGGAYLSNATARVTNASFSFCSAASSGGGLYISPEGTANKPTSFTNCTFNNNWVTDSNGKGGSLYLDKNVVALKSEGNGSTTIFESKAAYGGGIYQNDGTLSLSGTTINNCYATESGGGIYHAGDLYAHGAISGCVAKSGGGIYSDNNLRFNDVSNAMIISNCRAKNVDLTETGTVTEAVDFAIGNMGGGVYNAGGVFEASNVSVKGCKAYDGGGIYQDAGSFNLVNGTIGGIVEGDIDNRNYASNNGGGVYYGGGTFAMSGGAIGGSAAESNIAANGAGVYVAENQTMTMSGGSITNNRATTAGGGIATGSGATLNFSGMVSVKDNKLGEEKCNVYLDYDDNTIINNNGIDAGSIIGVYASDTQMEDHGRPNKLFGSYGSDKNHDRFLNDRVSFLFGMKASDNKMIWSDQVCRITDEEGHLLYRDADHSIPAVYSKLENSLEDSAFGVLSKDIPDLYTEGGDLYSNTEGYKNIYQVQMLVPEYALTKPIELAKNRAVTLTKAAKEDEFGFVYPNDDLKHPTPSIIRGAAFGSMVNLSQGSLTLTDIILDGNKANYAASDNGGLVSVSGGSVDIESDAVLRNSKTRDSGGALYITGGQAALAGTISGCEAQYGGGVFVTGGADVEFNLTSTGTVSGCNAQYGGGVRVEATMRMDGGSITGNTATVEGGGIAALGDAARVHFSGDAIVKGNELGGNPCNVQVTVTDDARYNGVINADGLGEKAEIGIYTAGDMNANPKSQYDLHGQASAPFGTWADDSNLYRFVNDRPESKNLRASRIIVPEGDANYDLIFWIGAPLLQVKNVVDSDWSDDKQKDFTFEVQLDLNGQKNPNLRQYGFSSDGKGSFVLKHGEEYELVLPLTMIGTRFTVTEKTLTAADDDVFDTTVAKNTDTPKSIMSYSGILGAYDSGTTDGAVVITYTNIRKKGEVNISKEVWSDVPTDKEEKLFHFTITLKDSTITKNYACIGGRDEDGKSIEALNFTKGVAEFSLKHSEAIRVSGLPVNLPFDINESLEANDRLMYRVHIRRNGAEDYSTVSSESEVIGVTSAKVGEYKLGETRVTSVGFINNRLPIVCKITRITDNGKELLKRKVDGELVDAVYFRLEDAFDQINRGGLKTSAGGSASGTMRIEMVVPEYSMERSATLNAGGNVILTTAEATDEDDYKYYGDTAVVYRGFDGNSMIVDNGALTLDRITLDGAKDRHSCAGNGGILRVDGNLTVNSGATLRNSIVAENFNGGAISLRDNATIIMNGMIDSCSAATNGGAIYVEGGFKRFNVGGSIKNCSANDNGGAIYVPNGTGTVTLDGATLERNNAAEDGGAVFSDAKVSIKNSMFADNAAVNGGGIYATGEVSIANDSKFNSNRAESNGGAIYVADQATVTIGGENTNFTNNVAKGKGGAIYDSGTVSMSAGEMTGNSADESGGAVYVGGAFSMKGRSSITGNASPEGAISTDEGAVLNFEGNVVVQDNYDTLHNGRTLINVHLGFDDNAIINTTGLGNNAKIGVYVADGNDRTIYYKHGIGARNFATYRGENPANAGLSAFVNDRDAELTAIDGEEYPDEHNVYYVMWIGKSLKLKVRTYDVQVDETTHLPLRNQDNECIPVENPALIVGAKFILTNITDPSQPMEVWSGESDEEGGVIIPWNKVEVNQGQTATFREHNKYKLEQIETGEGSVRPAGYWIIDINKNNKVEWTTQKSSEDKVNRTIDIEGPNIGEDDFWKLGDTFTLYNDRKPKIVFDANGGKLWSNRKAESREVKEETITFQTTQTNATEYKIEERDPVWNTKFRGWSRKKVIDSDDDILTEDEYYFYRSSDFDDLVLYAQWVEIVCKITDRDDNLLYVSGSPAIYRTLQDGFTDFNSKSFTTAGGETARPRKIKMLVPTYNMFAPVTLGRSKTATLTTASPKDTDGYPARNGVTTCVITRIFDDKTSMITNQFNLTLLNITLDGAKDLEAPADNGGIVRVENDYAHLILGADATLRNASVSESGGAIYSGPNTTVTIIDGKITDNSAAENGAGVYMHGGTLELNGGTITNNAAAGNGGGVYLSNKTNAIQGAGSTAVISGNSATDGGAVYMDSESHFQLASGRITGNIASADGAGIYVSQGSTLKLSGNPNFGGTGTENENGTNAAAEITGPKPTTTPTNGNYNSAVMLTPAPGVANAANGQKNYATARQDIFLDGFESSGSAATSIVVTDALTDPKDSSNPMPAGSIWVWAEQKERYEMLKQFAVFGNESVKMALDDAGTLESTMQAFRNAQADSVTGCGADYLTGQEGDDITTDEVTYKCIYWTGGFDFVFRKINGNGTALNGATFTLYKANSAGTGILEEDGVMVPYKRSGEAVTGTSANVTSGDAVTVKYKSGTEHATAAEKAIFGYGLTKFDKIPPGTYFLVETTDADGSATINGVKYKPSETMYKVVIDGKGWYDIYVAGKDSEGDALWTEAAQNKAPTSLYVKNVDKKYTDANAKLAKDADTIEIYTIMNVSTIERRVILEKVLENTFEALDGAQFRIFRADLSEITEGQPVYKEGDTIPSGKSVGDSKGFYESGTSGVYFVDLLPEGTYYLVEIVSPSGAATANAGKVFTLEVKDDMIRQVSTEEKITIPESSTAAPTLEDNLRTLVAYRP